MNTSSSSEGRNAAERAAHNVQSLSFALTNSVTESQVMFCKLMTACWSSLRGPSSPVILTSIYSKSSALG